MADAGVAVAVPVISPYRADRMRARTAHDAAGIPFYEVWVSTPLAVCEERDPKGFYARARTGELSLFTGIDAPHEAPEHPDLALDTASVDFDDCVNAILELIR